MRFDYSLTEVVPYINWIYFFHAWGTGSMPRHDQEQLRNEAEERLRKYADHYKTHALFMLADAYSEGDDIVLLDGERIPCLRQQQQDSHFLCLADFIASHDEASSAPRLHNDKIGLFATTVDYGMETDFDADPYEKMMMQLLADRLAEATAELVHRDVRTTYWGYAPNEQLSIPDLLSERWQGIRPAVGYPSLPDASLNFVLDRLLGMGQIGIRLTANGAMKPHASVSGLMLGHPAARYFTIGKIGEDQLADYADRRGVPVELIRKYLGGNL